MGSKAVTPAEAMRLAELEDRARNALDELAVVLAEIQDKRLYRATHKTFDAYCRDAFGISGRAGYRKVEQAKAAAALGSGEKPPAQRDLARKRKAESDATRASHEQPTLGPAPDQGEPRANPPQGKQPTPTAPADLPPDDRAGYQAMGAVFGCPQPPPSCGNPPIPAGVDPATGEIESRAAPAQAVDPEVASLRSEVERLSRDNRCLAAKVEELEAENKRLREKVAAARKPADPNTEPCARCVGTGRVAKTRQGTNGTPRLKAVK